MARFTQKAITKETRTWVFYYKTSRNGEWIVIGTQDCKQPERTKMRKLQLEYWKRPDVVGTGYTTELNNPELFWPQSKIPVTKEMIEEMNRVMEEGEAEDMFLYS